MIPLFSFKTLSTHFFLLCFFFIQAWGLNIIDIEETDFARTATHRKKDGTAFQSRTQIRLVDFDVTNQKMVNIMYLMTPQDKEYTFSYKGITITYQRAKRTTKITASIEKDQLQKDTWFVVPEEFIGGFVDPQAEVERVPDEVREDKWFIRLRGEKFIPSKKEDLLKIFKANNARSTNTSFPVQAEFISDEPSLSYNITGHDTLYNLVGAGEHRKEEGILGELASDLTFFAHGFTKKNSKLGGKKNNGFDGIYFKDHPTDPTKNQLWVVEAKFHGGSCSEKYFEGDLYPKVSKNGVIEKYSASMEPTLRATATLINDFIKNHPSQFVFLGYHVMSNGWVRTSFIRSHAEWFPPALLPKQEEQEKDLKTAVEVYMQNSPQKEDKLALARKILMDAGLTGLKVEMDA